MKTATESTSNNTDIDTTNTSSSKREQSPYLAQAKIPSEMLAPYVASNDLESLGYEYQYMSYDPSQIMIPQLSPYYQYQVPYYDPYFCGTASYIKDFPRAKDYINEDAILEAFPHLEGLNDTDFDIEKISPNAHFYIIRSSNDDNIHKAIKYHIWSSTPSGKNSLKKAWEEFEETGVKPEIYFLFTVVNSNQFLGIAKMMSNVNMEESFKYWWEPCKWFGTFQIQWLFIKDIHYSYFEHIREGGHPTSVVNLRDGTKISAESGKEILNVFKRHPVELNIFDSFEYMDRREDYIRNQRDDDPEFQQHFEQSCMVNQQTQGHLYPQKKQHYYRQNGRRPFGNRKYSHNPISNTANRYFQKATYHKKSEDGIKLNHHEFPLIQQHSEKPQNTMQVRNYSRESDYKRRNENSEPKNMHSESQGNTDSRHYQGSAKRSETEEAKIKEKAQNIENERSESQSRQDVQQELQGEAYGDHSQLC